MAIRGRELQGRQAGSLPWRGRPGIPAAGRPMAMPKMVKSFNSLAGDGTNAARSALLFRSKHPGPAVFLVG
jgi:hypothetical protein